MMNHFCAVCKKTAVQSCSACNTTYYCSKDHQKLHWKDHKLSCAPFKIISDQSGRSLVAIRDIKAGERILVKLPLLIGPKSEKDVICISCFEKIDQKSKIECEKCMIPCCSKNCKSKEDHINICRILERSKTLTEKFSNIYQFLIPLKILALKSKDFKKFDTILSNYIYQEPRDNFKNIVKEILDLCVKLGLSTNEEEILKIYVISKRNFLDITQNKSENIKGLYPLVPFLKQNCIPNTKNIFSEDVNQLSIIATIPIKKGEILTTNFAQPLWGTLERQTFLSTSKLIQCVCERCKDPTEYSTYLGSIYCQKCKDKLLVDESPKIISLNPLDIEAEWRCENCENRTKGKQMAFGNKSLGREIASQNMEQPKCLEHFLFKYGEVLHPTNSFSLRIKFKLLKLYGNVEEFKLDDLPQELLERKIQLCYELLEIADKLDPGFSRFRGVLLYELQATMVIQTKKEFCKELITKSEAEEKLKKSLDILHESCKILLAEPEFKETIQEKLEALNKMLEL